MKNQKNIKICVICSVGGHFKQILKLSPSYKKFTHYYVLMYKPIIDEFIRKENVYLVTSPERNPFSFFINIIESARVFLKEKPDVIISTGAGVAIATCYIAKLFRKKVIYIEDWCIVDHPSVTGRFVYPISDLFIIQRKHLVKYYPKAVFGGELF